MRITTRHGEGWISVPSMDKVAEPPSLDALKAEVQRRWGTIDLLDMLKEADFLTGFTGEFTSVMSREALPEGVLRRRLLLVLFALGTNVGIKRIADGLAVTGGELGDIKAALRRVRASHLTRDNLRKAIRRLVNTTLEMRDPGAWPARTYTLSPARCGSATTPRATSSSPPPSSSSPVLPWPTPPRNHRAQAEACAGRGSHPAPRGSMRWSCCASGTAEEN